MNKQDPTPWNVNEEDRLWTVRQAAEYFGVARQTIYRWAREGKIPYVQARPQHALRFCPSALRAMVVCSDRGHDDDDDDEMPPIAYDLDRGAYKVRS